MADEKKEALEEKTESTLPQDNLSVTEHSVTIGGKKIEYTVTTGTMVLKEEAEAGGDSKDESEGEKAKASVFFTAYSKKGVKDKAKRPLTFSFNGGPGSASVWLHMGVLGPKRVLMDDVGNPPPPPYQLVDNEYALLDETDLVFIDPVSTGYSRAVPGETSKQFHSFKKDIESVGDFIRLYTTRYQRWTSPKFLIGESYGTTRAAGLSGYLQQRHGMYLNGLMLISSILNFQTARFEPGNDLPHILYLPTFTATAWYHKKLKPKYQEDLQKTLREVEDFAESEYTLALMKGDALPQKDRDRIVRKLSDYTGLSKAYIKQTNMRLNIHRFVKELLRDERRTVGRLDSRFTGIDSDAAGEYSEQDPSMATIMGPYTATFYDYVRDELKFESDMPYEILSFNVNRAWSYAQHENQYVNVGETLRKAITTNPHLKVFVGNGYYDLATPYFATEYTFNHLGLDEEHRENISMGYYEAGHMMYVHLESLAKLKVDLSQFIQAALP